MGEIVGYSAQRDPAGVRDIERTEPDAQTQRQYLRQKLNSPCVRLSARLRPVEFRMRHQPALTIGPPASPKASRATSVPDGAITPCFGAAWYCCGPSGGATHRARFTGVCAFS